MADLGVDILYVVHFNDGIRTVGTPNISSINT